MWVERLAQPVVFGNEGDLRLKEGWGDAGVIRSSRTWIDLGWNAIVSDSPS